MGREEVGDLVLVLFLQKCAGGVDQAPAHLHQPCGAIQDLALLPHQRLDVVRLVAPARIGIAPPGARSAAGRVDQHAIEAAGLALHPFVAGRQQMRLDIVDAGAAQPHLGAVEPALRGVAGDQPALVLHGRGQRQRLAAGAGAIVDHLHAGLRVDQRRHDLRAFVLDLDHAAPERRPVLNRLPGA